MSHEPMRKYPDSALKLCRGCFLSINYEPQPPADANARQGWVIDRICLIGFWEFILSGANPVPEPIDNGFPQQGAWRHFPPPSPSQRKKVISDRFLNHPRQGDPGQIDRKDFTGFHALPR
jgi:hypothetical protein